ncbi:NnrS family protein [Colwellia sp. E150_009]
MLQPEILEKEQAIPPVLRLAFRPFFLLPALFSILALLAWICVLQGKLNWNSLLPANIWHGHEMIFGFAATVAVGFLLSAAQTWTGIRSINSWKLAMIIVFWLIARISLLSSSSTVLIIGTASEALWWVGSISYLAYMVVKSNNRRNLIFIPLLSLIMGLDIATLMFAFVGNYSLSTHLAYTAVFMITCVVTIVGGRVIPFFTTRALNLPTIKGNIVLERIIALAMIATLITFFSSYFINTATILIFLFTSTGCLQLLRMANWQTVKTFKTPLLWSLHLSYLNMGIGFIIIGLSYINSDVITTSINFSSAVHVITVGTIGTMIIAMMSRVSLGHTGRALQINMWISCSFILLLSATLFRVVLPTLGLFSMGYLLAALCWSLGFAIYLIYYSPKLLTARPDGRSG